MATRTYLQRKARRVAGRRAAVLLIVLTLLVLFVLIGVTFVLVSTRYRSTAGDFAKTEQQSDPPRKLFEEVLSQILVGPRSPHSSLWQHDLLGDLYGKDGFVTTVQNSSLAANTGGQFLQINLSSPPLVSPPLLGGPGGPGEHAGRVLTILSGPYVGISTRIVLSNGNSVTVETPRSDTNQPITALAASTQILINGAPFNGTGAGYESNGSGGYQRAKASDNGFELALMPHFARQKADWTRIQAFQNNEGYCAVDFQNMFMAKNVADGPAPSFGIIPSFHRPDLIRYWAKRNSAAWSSDPTFRARIMFRPDRLLHPNFTGSNPNFNAADVDLNGDGIPDDINGDGIPDLPGPWDVDNDGDGIPDSIWVDIGLPVRTAPNGQLYKPLVAIMIQDLDGRFDVNSHGNLAQVASGGTFTQSQGAYYAGGAGPSTPNLRRGFGTGPAGIDFRHVVSNYQGVLIGRYKDLTYSTEPSPVPGAPGNDPVSYLKDRTVPTNYYGGVTGVYGSPSDIFDQGTVGVDVVGQPIYQLAAYGDETSDDPYDANPHLASAGVQAKDNPYTVAELEAVLRRNDADALKLPQRLLTLIGAGAARFVTVRSSHVPSNAGNLPASKRGGENHLHGLFERSNIPAAQFAQFLPIEVLKGGKMNLNRRMGNGVDDNNNKAIDDAGEGNEMAWAPGLIPGYASPLSNYYGPVTGAAASQQQDRFMAKQLYARQLYVMAMLLADPAATIPTAQVFQQPTQYDEYKAQRIAQWAINCVDFSDPDAIMTPFEYDFNLLGTNGGTAGWQQNIDGNPATDEGGDRRLVWGCEYPDLLMTEVTAFHDKRLKDTAYDSQAKKLSDKDANMAQVDTDLDQWRVPQGSLFMEFYCPRAPRAIAGTPGGNPALPLELYSDGQNLNLGLATPNGDPVWRVCLSRPHNGGNSAYQLATAYPDAVQFQPEAMVNPLLGPATPLQVERYIFFTGAPPAGNDPTYNVPYSRISYYRRAGNALVSPGGYAVVGPRATTVLGVNRDGTATTLATLASQRIILGGNQITVTNATGGSNTINNVQTMVCAMDSVIAGYPQSGMNISEPLMVQDTDPVPLPFLNRPYGSPAYPSEVAPTKALYPGQTDGWVDPAANPPDPNIVPTTPFDYQQGRPLFQNNMMTSGTAPVPNQNHRTAFLQRLADPTMPFNPLANPYITIDWKPIDVTVFNGEDRPELPPHDALPMGFVYDNNDPNAGWTDPTGNPTGPSFGIGTPQGTRQSGDVAGPPQYNIWNQFAQPPQGPSPAAGTAIFNYSLKNTFGYLNYPMQVNVSTSLDAAPYPYTTYTTGGGIRIGPPQNSFPWLKIPNRPFVSAYEIMQVPASAPNRLMQEFTLGNIGGEPYAGVDTPGQYPANFRAPYGHLLNFFRTSPAITSQNPNPVPNLNLHRIFDFVEVPSRYVGTETWYNADAFGGAPANSAADLYRPPFNYMSKFQDPGLVNINTIFDNLVWDGGNGVSGVCGGRRPDWNALRLSRQGYANGSDAQYPSQFSNPFRPGWMADVVPIDTMAMPEVDVTLLRRGSGGTPLFADQPGNQYEDAVKHAHFRYDPLVAVGNRVKFTSNVYAVWMTVGFFQVQAVDPANPPALPNWQRYIPDGFLLGAELGVETGEINRHRAFYIIDRSIPVGYQPGEANNSERCVLLRRYLE